jgi:hypothetical protein
MMRSEPLPTSLRRPSRRRRWRAWVARYLIASLALPALGPLPWLVASFELDAHAAAPQHSHAHDDAHAGHHHHHDGDVPGSPTHPADHDCFACQVLAQLSRCCDLPSSALSQAPHAPVATTLPRVEPPLRVALAFFLAPPARGPPL